MWLVACVASEAPTAGDRVPHPAAGAIELPGATEVFQLRPTAEVEGEVIVELSGPEGTQQLRGTVGERLEVGLSPGRHGLFAWVDLDGDGAWTGIWGDAEPAARLGFVAPRGELELPLRTGVPEPFFDEDPAWVALHDRAWELLAAHVAAGSADNGFAEHYLDEAFSAQIFQWDTCFMTLFARYGADAFPVMPSLDNFYGVQAEDGYIGRVVDEDDGEPASPESDSEPMVNPPLFGWAEAEYLRLTGDPSRLSRVIPVLDAYHGWIDENLTTELGLYYTSMLGSGMDNAPRDAAYDAWVDMSAQQALGRRELAFLAEVAGDEATAALSAAEQARICADLEAWTWSGSWYSDLDADSLPLPDATLAGIWPLVAGCAAPERAAIVADALADPAKFWRPHPFPSTSAESAFYDPAGYYWRGGVWAPTEFAAVRGLVESGQPELARAATEAHLRMLSAVKERFVPTEGELAEDAPSDGLDSLWELYAPDEARPGTRWDATWLGRSDFVGWSGLGPTALLYEQVLGLEPDALEDRLRWTPTRLDHHGVRGYRFGDQLVDLEVEARESATDPLQLHLESSDAFVLEVGGEALEVPAGASDWTVEVAGPTRLVPAGPFAGSAVLGNGALVVVIGDDGCFDHVYVGDFGRDLVDGGGSRVVEGGEERLPSRVGLDPFFAFYAETELEGGGVVRWRAFVGEAEALVVEGELDGGETGAAVTLTPWVDLRAAPDLDGAADWTVEAVDGGLRLGAAGASLELRSDPAPDRVGAGDIGLELDGGVAVGRSAALALDLVAEAGARTPFRWTLGEATRDGLEEAGRHWAGLAACASDACRVASANLHAAAASRLGGDIPADLTGQFTTDGFPQLYPRDAMMVARALLAVGQADAARVLLQTWLGREGPSPGEWYARYDARGRAVDGGSGADFDLPEWDSNAYAALLAEALGAESWSADEAERILLGLDFLVAQQDEDGLWTEGGIVEWSGRLPGTAMAAWAGLDAGARLAEAWDQPERAASYRAAGGRVRGGLLLLFDEDADRLGDERDGALAMDSSAMFGPVLGFPDGPLTGRTAATLRAEESALAGGIRYFEGNDYGEDLFFFTTAAVLADARVRGDQDAIDVATEWMIASTNRFGLAPERVYADGSGAAPASPLSWCAAELGLALLAEAASAAVDGVVDPAEYLGNGLVDHDGEPDGAEDPVAVYTRQEGDALVVGLRTAGPPGAVRLWLSGADGVGSLGGDFLAEAGAGAVAVVDLDACDDCELAWGDRGVEARVPLASRGLAAPVQLVVETRSLLPATGAFRTEDDGAVWLTVVVEGAPGAPAISGDRAELGAWAAAAVPLVDDGSDGDEVAGDGRWTATVKTSRGGRVEWKAMVGDWSGVEFDGENRSTSVADPDQDGRVRVEVAWGLR